MTELTISVRISKEMERELEDLMRRERLEKSAAMRKALHQGLEAYRRDVALRLLAEGKATLSRAAEIAKVSLWEMLDMAKQRRIVWVSDDLMEDVPPLPPPRRR